MKYRSCIYIIFLTGLLFGGCRDKDIEEQRYAWYSDSPLTIPYRVRIQRLEKGNLVRNSSFETGRVFKLDSVSTSFVIDGWQQVGKQTQWVDIRNDSLYDHREALSGFRSIKISRKKAPETDEQGDGVISDFIKVIPGNYDLSFYARLEKIKPQKSRLGMKMYDGINISLLYYDRNKILIKPVAAFPYAGQTINNSFKSLSFANFDEIDSMKWCAIKAKSHHFPYPEGDIPSEAHFVKILISLKATGTMWIDSVDFHYTDRNFSVAEKMQEYTDTSFVLTENIIPAPKTIRKMQSIIFFHEDAQTNELPVIITEKNATKHVREAAAIIQKQLQYALNKSGLPITSQKRIEIVDHLNADQELHSALIFSLGKSELYLKHQSELSMSKTNEDQGYMIHSGSDNPNLIFINANTDVGIYYGVLTAVQLIDKNEPVFHSALVNDYPDYPNRFVTITSSSVNHEQLIKYKLNGAVFLKDNKSTGFYAKNEMLSIQPLFSIIPVDNYFTPDDTSLMYSYLINNVAGRSSENGLQIPPYFNNDMLDHAPTSYHHGNAGKYIYSGSSFFSLNTDAADVMRYTSAMKITPVFMDNSMLTATAWGQYNASSRFYPGKIRLFNVFEPYGNTEVKNFSFLLDPSMFIVNLPANSEISTIRLATAADFMWNGTSYSKNLSLWKVLCSRYGSETARLLILYAEKYSIFLEVLMKAGMNIQPAKNLKTGQALMTELTVIVAKISENTGSRSKLVSELQHINAGLRTRLNLSYSPIPVKK